MNEKTEKKMETQRQRKDDDNGRTRKYCRSKGEVAVNQHRLDLDTDTNDRQDHSIHTTEISQMNVLQTLVTTFVFLSRKEV